MMSTCQTFENSAGEHVAKLSEAAIMLKASRLPNLSDTGSCLSFIGRLVANHLATASADLLHRIDYIVTIVYCMCTCRQAKSCEKKP